ncbi:MAG: [protein-PII] uridylyltransferase [Planctomycetes bacterium]|nr:[protein-PII] uridylyltransferase [Planctomycetota bacterium]
MSTTLPRFRPSVLAAKERLAAGREKLKQRHQRGSPGIQVSAALTDLLDEVVLGIYQAALADLKEDEAGGLGAQIALIAHGGYGRRDVAPYSDVDLMILHPPEAAARVEPLAARLMRDVFDAGLQLGNSVRTIPQACQLARKDAAIRTSLLEARYLAGSVTLFSRFITRFQQQAHRRLNGLITAVAQAREDERVQFGETSYLLEPNVKRSGGGLRDLQLLRWIGFARYSTAEYDGLLLHGALTREEHQSVLRALEFLLRLRNELHFAAGRSSDVLDRSEQVRIAELFGYRGDEAMLPVEQFMREYFCHTNFVTQLAARFVANARPGSRWKGWLALLASHQFERDFRIEPTQVSLTPSGLAKLEHDLSEVLRLADVANLHDKRIAHSTREAVRRAVPNLPAELTRETASRFRSLLDQPAKLGEMLRFLYETGILERIIPAFTHARSLLQFNEYHKYTVDEHSLRAVESAASLLSDPGPVGQVYRSIKTKWLLHLALLLHDLGKGFAEDHSDVGLRIADETAQRLHLAERDRETLKLLVHKHLVMSHLAFRRDIDDTQLVVRFAVEVGSPDVLQMLYVLTAADMSAVGPGVWTNWKAEVLTALYHYTMQHLAGDSPGTTPEERLQDLRGAVQAALAASEDREWYERHIGLLPNSYLRTTPTEQAAAELRQLHSLGPSDAKATGRYQAESGTVQYTVVTHENVAPGIFHRLTGALSDKGLQILSAEINTLADGLVLDRFHVVDPDYAGEPPSARIDDVCRTLVGWLRPSEEGEQRRPQVRRWGRSRARTVPTNLPTQVRVDNNTSDRYTTIDVFAADQQGLLYTITRTLFELGLSVSLAKIATHLDQVVDVFYVTDQFGQKVRDEGRLETIRHRLMGAIESLEAEGVGVRG